MYFKIDKKSDLFKALKKLQKDMHDARMKAFNLAEELGFSQIRRSNYPMSIAGGISSFYCEKGKKPDNFAYTYGPSSPNDIFPKRIKSNKDILNKIKELPIIDCSRLNDLINYHWLEHKYPNKNGSGSHILFAPSVNWNKGNILISFPDYVTKYKPVTGMIEITFSEFQKLNK